MTMTITGYPFDSYDGSDEEFEKLLETYPLASQPTAETDGKCRGHRFPSQASEIAARLDAERDFASAAARTVAPGRCTLCEMDASELVPWGHGEKLCWYCVSFQLDLMARAIREGNITAVNSGPQVRWA